MFPVSEDDMVLNPYQIGALRVLIAGIVLLPIAIKHLSKLKGKPVFFLLLAGLCGNLLPAMLFPIAQTNISSSLAGLLNSTTSLFVVLIGIFVFKAKPSIYQLIGLALASTGLYLVLNTQFNIESSKNIWYALFIFPATLCYAISLTTIKFKLQQFKAPTITSLTFLLMMIPALIICIYTGAFESISSHPDGMKSLGYLSILAVVGTAIAVLLFTRLIAIASHIFASAIAYLLPVVALILGHLDGETFPMISLLWVAVILIGVFLMNKSGKKAEKS